MASRIYDFRLPAAVGGTVRIEAMGTRCTLMTSVTDKVAVVIPDLGVSLVLKPGQTYTAPDGLMFRQVVVQNLYASQVQGSIFIGDGSLSDNAVSGTVNTRTAEDVRVMADVGFIGSAQFNATTNKPAVQLLNTSIGTRRFALTKVHISTSVAAWVYVYRSSAQLINVGGTNTGKASKWIQSTAAAWVIGQLELRTEELPAVLSAPMAQFYLPAGTYQWELEQPFVLDLSQNITIVSGASAAMLAATFEGYQIINDALIGYTLSGPDTVDEGGGLP